MSSFEVVHEDAGLPARTGLLRTAHGPGRDTGIYAGGHRRRGQGDNTAAA